MSQNNDKEACGESGLCRGLMLIEILSNYPNGCRWHLSGSWRG